MNKEKMDWIKKMKVEDFMEEAVYTVRPEDSIEKVFDVFQKKKVRTLPVTDGRSYLEGKITETDLMKLFMSSKHISTTSIFGATTDLSYFAKNAKDMMKKYKITLKPDESIPHAAKKIVESQVVSLPVVSENNRLVGVFHAENLIREVTR